MSYPYPTSHPEENVCVSFKKCGSQQNPSVWKCQCRHQQLWLSLSINFPSEGVETIACLALFKEALRILPSDVRERLLLLRLYLLRIGFYHYHPPRIFQAACEESPIRHLRPFHSLLFPNQIDSTRLSSVPQRFKILNFLSPAEA